MSFRSRLPEPRSRKPLSSPHLSTLPSPSLALLREIVVEASRAPSLQGQIDCVVNKVHEAMRAEVCSLYLSEPVERAR